MPDYEELSLENALFPWLDSDCMADEFTEPGILDFEEEEDSE